MVSWSYGRAAPPRAQRDHRNGQRRGALLRRVAALGVDAVATDDPAALRARLAVAA